MWWLQREKRSRGMAGKGIAIRGNRRVRVVSGGATALTSLWGMLTATASTISAANNVPPVWRFIVNTPDAIPWILAAGAIILFMWTLLPAKEDEVAGEEPVASVTTTQTTHGPQSPNIGTVHGNVLFAPPPPPEPQPRKAPRDLYPDEGVEALGRIAKGLAEHEPQRTKSQPPPLQPDMPLREVVARIYKSLGGLPDADERPQFYQRVDRIIANAAKLRGLCVWGYPGPRRAISLLNEYHWSEGSFDHREGSLSLTDLCSDPMTTIYTDLELNRVQVENFWPSPPEENHDGRP